MKQLYIIGAGSVGGHIATNPYLYGLEDIEILFLDHDPEKINKTFVGKRIVGSEDLLINTTEPVDIVIGIAFPKIKRAIYDKLKANPLINFPTLISKNAWISERVKIGQGVIVYPNCSINYGSDLADFTILNMNCAVGHESQIGQFSSLAPGVNLGGNTIIGKNTEIGIGSSTKQFIQIGNDVIIGGQSMVVNDLESGTKAKGVPAKKF